MFLHEVFLVFCEVLRTKKKREFLTEVLFNVYSCEPSLSHVAVS